MVRRHSFMMFTKKGGELIWGFDWGKFWVILQMVVNGVLGMVIFLGLLTSTNSKSKFLPFHRKFFFLFWLLTVKYFFETYFVVNL